LVFSSSSSCFEFSRKRHHYISEEAAFFIKAENTVGGRVAAADLILLEKPMLRDQVVSHPSLNNGNSPITKRSYFRLQPENIVTTGTSKEAASLQSLPQFL
jgi:hypothetical protein